MNGRALTAPATVAILACSGLLAGASPAGATATVGPVAGMTFDLGPSPVGLPSNCPFPNDDANFLFTSGNGVNHESVNKNGGWGGETAEGSAVFYEDSTPIATGHLTIWGGGGGNARGQNEGGLTLSFVSATVTIHVHVHQTTNANGTPTANAGGVEVTCS
ncbi:MAG: hypothetical protein QOD07_1366 [Frankiaceae bacterium]|jgi:hypothetical protein|nr:hypothetical protein [Frankiaceae bacterium]